jgi:hypothetical protein
MELFILARLHARPGNEAAVAEVVREVVAPSREEPRFPSAIALFIALLVVGGCVANPPMPPSVPLRGQTAETMQRDRADCEHVALTDPSITAATAKGGGQASAWTIGAPDSATGRLVTRQRHASFGLCMESRGYKVDREP